MSISYLLYSSILVGLFYLLYEVLLSKETFFRTNRFILLSGIFLSLFLPSIPTPVKISVGETKIETRSFNITELNVVGEVNTTNEQTSIANEISKDNIPITLDTPKTTSQLNLLMLIYLLGLGTLLSNLVIQLFKLLHTIAKHKVNSSLVQLPYESSPSSFFNYIFIGKNDYPKGTMGDIILHEKIHSVQKHSMDILIAELLVVVQWFNPFAWLYRKSIEKNLEFLVDEEMLKVVDSKKNYQYNLLNLAVKNFPLSVVTNYNQSLIKIRIKMMNTKKSSLRQSWKYFCIVPMIILTVFIFNPSNISGIPFIQEDLPPIMVIINANATQADLNIATNNATTLGYSLSYSDLVWDSNNNLKHIKAKLSSDYGSLGNDIDYSDVTRHMPIVMYQHKDGSSSIVKEGPLSDKLINKILNLSTHDTDIEKFNKIKVVTSFNKDIIDYQDFINSKTYTIAKDAFSKELKWQEQFVSDRINETNSFRYFINEKAVDIKELKSIMDIQEVREIVIKEKNSDKPTFHVYSVPQKGFISKQSTTTYVSSHSNFKTFKQFEKSLIADYKEKNPTAVIKYYQEGLEKENLISSIDSTEFKRFFIVTGSNFDQYGNHLGEEIRVNYLK